MAPTAAAAGSPSLNRISVGIDITPKRWATAGCSSMFSFTIFRSSRSSAIWSSTGAIAWHGPHHSAQKSTSTGCSLPSTCVSKVSSVTESISDFSFLPGVSDIENAGSEAIVPTRYDRPMEQVFVSLPTVPDHPGLERDLLERWEEEGTFERLREQNSGGPRFGFMDGPITANAPAGVHHGHGRTLKDVFQRYKAMRGFDQRYQNGFDSQGLWVEVEVERSLGLASKREIEEFGLAEFARKCRERVAHYSEVMTEQFRRLGQWMDWDNDYYTFSDTNIEYIWGFLKVVQERGWLYKGHRSTQWCPRCGTSLSQHEQAGEENYVEMEHPSLFVRFPLAGPDGEALVVWTTTPWTLPANVAAAVKPDAEYVLSAEGEWRARDLAGGIHAAPAGRGGEPVGLEYEGPFDDLPAQEGVRHRVIPWDEVSLDEGTGIVHIAPGAGAEDFELSRVHDLPVLAPIDESGRFLPGYGPFAGLSTAEVAKPVT